VLDRNRIQKLSTYRRDLERLKNDKALLRSFLLGSIKIIEKISTKWDELSLDNTLFGIKGSP
jgi:hypothetical protein